MLGLVLLCVACIINVVYSELIDLIHILKVETIHSLFKEHISERLNLLDLDSIEILIHQNCKY